MAEGEDGAISFQLQTTLGKKKLTDCQLTVSSSAVTWKRVNVEDDKPVSIARQLKSAFENVSLLEPVIPVRRVLISKSLETGQAEKVNSSYKLDIHYSASAGDSKDKYRLCHKVATFYGDKGQCDACSEKIAQALRIIRPSHPRRLLVIINPVSGSGSGVKVYKKKVNPLMEIAEIQTDVIITTHANQSEEILDKYDLTSIHGIGVVGGDGTFREVACGLLKRLSRDSGIGPNDESTSLPHTTLPIGILPLGTGNGLANGFFRTKDLITATLGVIMGEECMKSVNTVHSDGKFLDYNFLLMGYGVWANVGASIEELRWMGIARHLLTPVFLVKGRTPFEVEVQCLVEENNKRKSGTDDSNGEDSTNNTRSSTSKNIRGQADAEDGNSMANPSTDIDHVATAENKSVWHTFTGSVIGVDMFAADFTVLTDISKFPDAIAAGRMTVLIVKPCSVVNQVKQLFKLVKGDPAALQYDFLEHYTPVVEYRIRAVADEYAQSKEALRISFDGDVRPIPASNITVRCRGHILRSYCFHDVIDCEQT